VRKKESKEVQALSMPLVVDKTTGRKFGKSEAGAIWLDAKKTSVYKFYQFWYNVGDEDAADYLKIFTLLPKDEIDSLESQQKQDPASRPAQKRLAYEVTAIVHGQDLAKKQERIAQALFSGGDISGLDESEIATVRDELPGKKVQPGSSVIEVLVESGLASSNSEARRLLDSKAIYVNNQPFQKPHLDSADFKDGRLILRRGKAYKDSALVELA
jgi:tyrosyl-tRNA synthetase